MRMPIELTIWILIRPMRSCSLRLLPVRADPMHHNGIVVPRQFHALFHVCMPPSKGLRLGEGVLTLKPMTFLKRLAVVPCGP